VPTPLTSAAMMMPRAISSSVNAAWASLTAPGVSWPTAISAVAAHR